MKCPNCGARNYACLDTRHDDAVTVRRYKCKSCEYLFKTEENAVGLKRPEDTRFAPIGVGVNVDGREILNSLRKPVADMRRILRTYDERLK